MKDEIKEIFDKIKKQLEADEGMGFEIAKDFHKTTLNYKEIKLLLDYITNLQEENERLKDTMSKIKDLNTMQYLRDDIFKEHLSFILQGSDKE